jgi:hypothetical protein
MRPASEPSSGRERLGTPDVVPAPDVGCYLLVSTGRIALRTLLLPVDWLCICSRSVVNAIGSVAWCFDRGVRTRHRHKGGDGRCLDSHAPLRSHVFRRIVRGRMELPASDCRPDWPRRRTQEPLRRPLENLPRRRTASLCRGCCEGESPLRRSGLLPRELPLSKRAHSSCCADVRGGSASLSRARRRSIRPCEYSHGVAAIRRRPPALPASDRTSSGYDPAPAQRRNHPRDAPPECRRNRAVRGPCQVRPWGSVLQGATGTPARATLTVPSRLLALYHRPAISLITIGPRQPRS